MAYTFKHGDRPLDGFVIQRGVGRGGFGEVYYAISDGGREVALKYLRDNSDVELRGVTHCMNLKSPHLVTIFDVKKNADGEYFIIMEYIAGPSLAELLVAEPSGLGVEKAAFLVREIGKGLAYLHDRGIVHRDMKPANIFYEDGHIKIGDYGLSKFISVSRHSAQTTSVGTVHYMAPEVGSGNYHRGIDIYALGVMLYEMLLGKVPFEGSSMGEVLMKHLTEQPEVEGLPKPFGAVIRKALAKDPKDRYQNVNEMIDDMLEVGEVRDSLASFNPNSISAIPRRPAADPLRTPVPSPNPMPPPMPSLGLGVGPHAANLPPGAARRVERISEKVHRRMDKLAGRRHRPRPRGGPNAAIAAMAQNQGKLQRYGLAFIITIGASVALGLLVGGLSQEPALGATAGMMVVMISVGIRVAIAATRWLGASAQPGWVQKIVRVACCAPPMAIANAPVWATWNEGGFGLPIGLLAAVLFASWDKRIDSGARGELSFGNAFYIGLFGLMTCYISTAMCDGPEELVLVGAAILAVVSLVIEAVAWFLPPKGLATTQAGAEQGASESKSSTDDSSQDSSSEPDATVIGIAFGGRKSAKAQRRSHVDDENIPFGVAVEPGTPVSGTASTVSPHRPRSGFERGFFSVVAFILLLGMVTNIIFAALGGAHFTSVVSTHGTGVFTTPTVITGTTFEHIAMAGACGAFMLFCMSKLTLRKRRNFWRESLCPFLIAVVASAICASISLVATNHLSFANLAIAVVGIVCPGLVLLLLIATLVWPHRPRPARATDPTMQEFIGGDKPAEETPNVTYPS